MPAAAGRRHVQQNSHFWGCLTAHGCHVRLVLTALLPPGRGAGESRGGKSFWTPAMPLCAFMAATTTASMPPADASFFACAWSHDGVVPFDAPRLYYPNIFFFKVSASIDHRWRMAGAGRFEGLPPSVISAALELERRSGGVTLDSGAVRHATQLPSFVFEVLGV